MGVRRFAAAIGLAGALLAPAAPAHAAPSAAEAARFLAQATFGPTEAEIANVQRMGYEGWLDAQFSRSTTLHRPELQGLLGLGLTDPDQAQRQEIWWRHAVTAPDQLRQRVGFALSEILVVSSLNDQLGGRPLQVAEFYDTLLRGAFGNYRQLLEQVTLAPAMGLYLSMIRNDKPDAASGRRPDENFAREVMQLFSIGLWQLNADGSDRLDGSGNRIPTYDQATVENYARAYTGWTWADAAKWGDNGTSYAPMKAFEERHDTDAKTLLDGRETASGLTAAQDLKIALDSIFQHPNAGPFIARRLIQRLVSSNPSPDYIRRIAQVFADNGAGVRGDLKALVHAILLDPEARTPAGNAPGKLREPLLRLSAVWRAFSASAQNGKFAYREASNELGQAAQAAPSVFNYFQPDFRPSGRIADAGLRAPEFQIQTESHGMSIVNTMVRFILKQYEGEPNQQAGTITIKIAREQALANNPGALADHLGLLLLNGRMPAAMRQALISHLESIDVADTRQRAVNAIFLVATSPEFAVLQ
ncbi:MAG TPA: DUF1800 domain-containing protein [Solimonas sp.]|nr:DUF1800 domain-containing protein [Solimonas sp.]